MQNQIASSSSSLPRPYTNTSSQEPSFPAAGHATQPQCELSQPLNVHLPIFHFGSEEAGQTGNREGELPIPLLSPSFVSSDAGGLFDADGRISPEVRRIFSAFQDALLTSQKLPQETIKGILETDRPTIQHFNLLAQDKFLRPQGSERMDRRAQAHYRELCAHLSTAQKADIISLFQTIGDIDPVYPVYKTPDYILIQGSTVANMRERIMFLAELVSQRRIVLLPRAEIVFLAGERALFDTETPEVLTNPEPFPVRLGWEPPHDLPVDERGAARMVWEQLDLPAELRYKFPFFVEAPKKQGAQRAQTEDCVRAWLESPLTGKGACLILSSNPFVRYQTKVTEMIFKRLGVEGFTLEGVGSKAKVDEYPQDLVIGILMDNLARTLYVENAIREL